MSSVSSAKKKIGRPSVESEAVNTRIAQPLLAALDTFISTQPDPKPSRPEAIRYLLRDSLAGLGLLKHREDPEGSI